MPRPPRIHVPGGCYHITLRGNHREALFDSAADRRKLDFIVVDALARFDVRLHAFCWMTNHLHALVQVDAQPLAGFMKSVATRYSRYRHKALDTTGHLFERRYDARLVAMDSYFLAVLRYIHLNPVQAGIAADPAAYPWSSHRAYLGTQSIDWVNTTLGLSLLGEDPRQARSLYRDLLDCCPATGQDELDSRANPNDPRILGDDSFVAQLVTQAPTAGESSPLDALARDVCGAYGISPDELRSRAKFQRLTPVRLELLDRALRSGTANLAEVARYLDRDPSTLCKQRKLARLTAGGNPTNPTNPTNPMTGTK